MPASISSLIKELNTAFPDYTFTNVRDTYSADAIIRIRSKALPNKDTDLAYYGGDRCGYIPYSNFTEIYKFLKSKLTTCRCVSDFIDGPRKGFFEIYF